MNPLRRHAALLASGLLLLAIPASAQHAPPAEGPSQPTEVADSRPEWIPPAKPAAAQTEVPDPAPGQPSAPSSEDPPRSAFLGGTDLAGLLLFDEPGDGALWVLGGEAYKVRFGSDGPAYLPYFGALAPRNFPLELRLEEVRVGARRLDFEPEVAPARRAELVSYDRGSLVESYRLTSETMEQLFHFDHVPTGGDLTLRIAVTTELEGRATDEGLEFSSEHGLVRYSRAVAFDAAGARCTLETTFEDGAIRITVPAAFLARAVLPLTIDPILQTTFIDTDPASVGSNLDVAYDSGTDRYCIVWQRAFSATDHDVFCQLFDANLIPVPASTASIDFTNDLWELPRIASNIVAHQFLVVCQTSANGTSPFTVRGRTRQAGSNSIGAPFEVSAGQMGDKLRPDVGGDPTSIPQTYYCVVWERRVSAQDHDIHYQLVDPNGSLFFPSAQVIDNSSGSLDRFVSISKSNGRAPLDSQRWNVAWQRNFGPGDEDIYGAQIAWNGNLATSTFPIDTSALDDRAPQVSSPLSGGTGEREYLVVYERHQPTGSRIQGRALRGNLPVTSSTNLSALQSDPAGADQFHPSVDSDGNVFVLLYAEHAPGPPQPNAYRISTFDLSLATGALVPTETRVLSTVSAHDPGRTRITSKQSGTAGVPNQPFRFLGVYHYVSNAAPVIDAGVLYDAVSPPGTPYCFGVGAPSQCPCGNTSSTGRGCRNSTGAGCRLTALGTNRASQGNFALRAEQALPGLAGMFFMGYQAHSSGNGILYGDGRLCATGIVKRLQVVLANAEGTATSTISIPTASGISPGDRRFYQYWYRDTQGECGSGFNLSNGYEVTWIW